MKTLIVVDMQNDFVTGVLGCEAAQAIVPNVIAKVREYLEDGHCVVFTLDTHLRETYSNTREGKNLPVPHCILNTTGQELIADLDIIVDTMLDDKVMFAGIEVPQITLTVKSDQFGLPIYDMSDPSDAPRMLQELESIEFIGIATNICVISCAICSQNIFKNVEHIIDASCCASYDKDLHEKALDVMEGLQFKVINRC